MEDSKGESRSPDAERLSPSVSPRIATARLASLGASDSTAAFRTVFALAHNLMRLLATGWAHPVTSGRYPERRDPWPLSTNF